MKALITIVLSVICLASYAQNEIPKGFEKIAEKTGDLDKDGIAEKVIVYNTPDSGDGGIVRELQILKQSGNIWTVWQKSKAAILKSQEGGMMGEPFQEIEIEKGIMIITFAGGSSWKWSHADKYRFQENEFRLIGYSSSFGKPCEYWGDFDFNLLTGKIIYKKEYEKCEDERDQKKVEKTEAETFFKKGIHYNLSNRYLKDTRIITPKYKHDLYL